MVWFFVLVVFWCCSARGGQLVNACYRFHAPFPVTTSGSCFLPSRKTQSLPDFTKPSSVWSTKQSQVLSSLPCEKDQGACQCQPPAQNVVRHRHWSITHRSTNCRGVPDKFELSEGVWSLHCHASQLPQARGRLHFARDPQGAFWRRASAQIHGICFCVSCTHRAATTAVRSELIVRECSHLQANHTWRTVQPNTKSS